jgi:hypothetical protein
MRFLTISASLLLAALSGAAQAASDAPAFTVSVKTAPTDAKWQAKPTRTLDQLTGFAPSKTVGTSRWGGWLAHREGKGEGFFRVKKASDGRWWFIDPEGYRFLHVGIAGVYQGIEKIAADTTREKFSTTRAWADFTLGLLRENHFNGLGGWTEREAVADHPKVLPYSVSLDFVGDFGRFLEITHVNPGQTGYINEVPPIFHPDFPAWCEKMAERKVSALKDDPMLIGFFSDNEIPLRREMLDRSLELDPAIVAVAPLREAAVAWLRERKGPDASLSVADLTDDDRSAFLVAACERYFSNVAAALRKYDPNHLYLGTRFHGRVTQIPEVFRAAGRHVDVVSVNLYHTWSVKTDRLAMWTKESGRPVIITEFYAKGMDTGLENVNGAGWVVKTQEDRGNFYQNFTLSLLAEKNVVGWHWFKYRDNEHFDEKAQLGNQDTNKGILSWDYQLYTPLLEKMKALNAQVYPLTDYFDRRR